jgi:hypothetical protein
MTLFASLATEGLHTLGSMPRINARLATKRQRSSLMMTTTLNSLISPRLVATTHKWVMEVDPLSITMEIGTTSSSHIPISSSTQQLQTTTTDLMACIGLTATVQLIIKIISIDNRLVLK